MPSSAPLSKSRSYSGVEYEPLWEKAKYHEIRFPDKIARTYEVPLKMDAGIGGILLKNGNHASEAAKMSSSLVVQEFEQGDKRTRRQIMATIVGNDSGGNTSSAAFSYMGSRETFTGFMIVSTVSGKILNIFQYINGERTVMYLKNSDTKSSTGYYKGVRFIKSLSTRASGGGTIPGVCYQCGKTGDVYPDYGHICTECLEGSEFLDDVLVDGERPKGDEGGGSGCTCTGGNCNCLRTGSLICTCIPEDNPGTGCSYCTEPGCNGECQNGGGENGNGNNENNSNSESDSLKVTLTNNAVFNSLCQEVLDIDNDLIKEVISNLELSKMNLSIKFSNTLSDRAIGYIMTDAESETKTFVIEFQESVLLLDENIQQVAILHEILHLNLCLIIYDKQATNYQEVSTEFNKYFYEYNKDFNAASHEYFASFYLLQIEEMIDDNFTGLDADKAKWASLTNTNVFKKLEVSEKDSIMRYLEINDL